MNTSTASTAPAASSVQTSSAPAVALPRVAIACQGGGAHTAFTAGALAYLFLAIGALEQRNLLRSLHTEEGAGHA